MQLVRRFRINPAYQPVVESARKTISLGFKPVVVFSGCSRKAALRRIGMASRI